MATVSCGGCEFARSILDLTPTDNCMDANTRPQEHPLGGSLTYSSLVFQARPEWGILLLLGPTFLSLKGDKLGRRRVQCGVISHFPRLCEIVQYNCTIRTVRRQWPAVSSVRFSTILPITAHQAERDAVVTLISAVLTIKHWKLDLSDLGDKSLLKTNNYAVLEPKACQRSICCLETKSLPKINMLSWNQELAKDQFAVLKSRACSILISCLVTKKLLTTNMLSWSQELAKDQFAVQKLAKDQYAVLKPRACQRSICCLKIKSLLNTDKLSCNQEVVDDQYAVLEPRACQRSIWCPKACQRSICCLGTKSLLKTDELP
ncbi:hypothetical protein RRG08_007964 [Elysia crispata]|uniref:Uncharacterized protein n=1 Tax=Elysia crispata TaxID=231223 RepID=A0AAE1DK61_9GAST|nr:hypothetical protein RRG08_007964 [Elysia crispata]